MRPSIIALSLVVSSVAAAQTPSSLESLTGAKAEPKQCPPGETCRSGLVAGNNPWLVAGSMSIKPLAGDGGFSDQWLLTSSKISYEIPFDGGFLGGMKLPVMANLADITAKLQNGSKTDSLDAQIQSLTNSEEGINLGLYPYWALAPNNTNIRPTLFAAMAAKVNSFLTDSATKTRQTLMTGRFGGGIEFALGNISADQNPLTISLAAIYSTFGRAAYQKIFGEARSSLVSGELTMMIPLKSGVGAIFEGTAVQEKKPGFRLGLMFAAAKNKTDAGSDNQTDRTATKCGSAGCVLTVDNQTTAVVHLSMTAQQGDALNTVPKDCSTIATTSQCLVTVPAGHTIALTLGEQDGTFDGIETCNGKKSCTVQVTQALTLTIKKPQ